MAAPNEIDRLLDDDFADTLEQAREQSRVAVKRLHELMGGVRKAVIMGSAYLGRLALSGAINAGLDVVAFADNNRSLWRTTLDGVPIMSPADAVSKHNNDAFFVVAIYNGTPLRAQLTDLGCRRVVPYPMFFWQFSQSMPQEDRLELPDRIFASAEAAHQGFNLLSDHRSRAEFVAQIQWRCTLDYACLPPPERPSDMYFGSDIIGLKGDEVLVDCGAFDGDSIRMFLDKTGGSFGYIYALEPDSKNRDALNSYLSSLLESQAKRISVLPFGASDSNETKSFDAAGTVGSRIIPSDSGESIECRRLDDLLDGPSPTFIKMDIEGTEPEAIKGAIGSIRESRPIVAACAYHKCEHLWTLPILLKEALPDYRISLRRYAEECWETVYYAIPPERAIPSLG